MPTNSSCWRKLLRCHLDVFPRCPKLGEDGLGSISAIFKHKTNGRQHLFHHMVLMAYLDNHRSNHRITHVKYYTLFKMSEKSPTTIVQYHVLWLPATGTWLSASFLNCHCASAKIFQAHTTQELLERVDRSLQEDVVTRRERVQCVDPTQDYVCSAVPTNIEVSKRKLFAKG